MKTGYHRLAHPHTHVRMPARAHRRLPAPPALLMEHWRTATPQQPQHMISADDILAGLDPDQRAVATELDGPMRVGGCRYR